MSRLKSELTREELKPYILEHLKTFGPTQTKALRRGLEYNLGKYISENEMYFSLLDLVCASTIEKHGKGNGYIYSIPPRKT